MDKVKEIKVNGHSFNADFYKDWKEEDFIKDQWDSIPTNVGNDAKKTALLKEAFALIKKANGTEKPTAGK